MSEVPFGELQRKYATVAGNILSMLLLYRRLAALGTSENCRSCGVVSPDLTLPHQLVVGEAAVGAQDYVHPQPALADLQGPRA